MKVNINYKELIIKIGKKSSNLKKFDIINKISENSFGADLNEIHIKYEIKKLKYKKLKILGNSFVENNCNNCQIIYNGKIFNLLKEIKIDKIIKIKGIIIIKLKGIKTIKLANGFFSRCDSVTFLINF